MTGMNQRRSTDNVASESIQKLILESDNPKDKAMLLIMYQMCQSLADNTKITQELSESHKQYLIDFGKHEKKEMELINQGRGAWRILLGVLIVVQGLIGWALTDHIAKNREQDMRLVKVEEWKAVHQNHHEMEERGTVK